MDAFMYPVRYHCTEHRVVRDTEQIYACADPVLHHFAEHRAVEEYRQHRVFKIPKSP